MACNHCDEFSRAAPGAPGGRRGGPRACPRSSPGCRRPAGTGLNRRSFLLRSSAAMLSVYGASKLRLGDLEEGIAQAAGGNDRVLVSIFLDGGIDSLSVLAPTDRPDLPSPAAQPGSAAGCRHRVRRGPAACAGTRPRRPFDDLHRGGQDDACSRRSATRAPTSRTSPRATTGRSAACCPNEITGWMGRLLDLIGTRRQPASGPLARRLAVAGARHRLGPGGGDRRALLRPLGAGRLGRARGADVRRGRRARAQGAAAARTPGARPPAAPPRRRCSSKAQLQPFSGEEITPPVAYPDGDGRAGSATASRRSRRCSPPACRSAARRSRRPATSTPTTTRPRASTPTSSIATDSIAAFQADLEARGLADRVITLVWSEFGRRPEENDSGTDHGAGGAAYVIGTQVARPDDRRVPGPRPARRRRQPPRDLRLPRRSTARSIEQWFGVDAGAVIPDAGSFGRGRADRVRRAARARSGRGRRWPLAASGRAWPRSRPHRPSAFRCRARVRPAPLEGEARARGERSSSSSTPARTPTTSSCSGSIPPAPRWVPCSAPVRSTPATTRTSTRASSRARATCSGARSRTIASSGWRRRCGSASTAADRCVRPRHPGARGPVNTEGLVGARVG